MPRLPWEAPADLADPADKLAARFTRSRLEDPIPIPPKAAPEDGWARALRHDRESGEAWRG